MQLMSKYYIYKLFLNYCNSRETFNNVDKWIEIIRSNNNELNMNIMLIGNKSDLNEGREVKYEEGEQKKKDCNLDGFLEISAKNGNGFEELFKQISKILYDDIFNDSDIRTVAKRKIRLELHEENQNPKKCT